MTGNTCRLGLHGLGSSYLQPLGRGIGVECHILSFERSRLVAVLTEDTTKGSGEDALAYIAPRADEHDGMELFHTG